MHALYVVHCALHACTMLLYLHVNCTITYAHALYVVRCTSHALHVACVFQERSTTPLCFDKQHPKPKTRARTSTHASSAPPIVCLGGDFGENVETWDCDANDEDDRADANDEDDRA